MRVRGARHRFGPTDRAATRKFVVLSDQLNILVADVGEALPCHQRREVIRDMDLLKMFAISGVGMSAKRSRMSVITGNLATKIEDSRHRTLTDEQRAWALTKLSH